MKVDTEKLKVIAIKHAVAMAEELAVEIAFPALKMAVEQSETKVDDVVLAALEAPLKAAILDQLKKLKV